MTAVDDLTNQLFDVMQFTGDRTREIVITPYNGNYDRPAGYVIAIKGSPPKGTLFVPYGWTQPCFLFQHGRMSRIDYDNHAKRYDVILDYLKAHVEGFNRIESGI